MYVDIPVFIVLLNDTELNIYKNTLFLHYFIEYLKYNGIYNNCVFLYNGKENENILGELEVNNKYKISSIDKISHLNEYHCIYEYLTQVNDRCDWFINLDVRNYNPNTLYLSIQNINDNYDFICFKNEISDNYKYILDDNKRVNDFSYHQDIIHIINTSLFVTKKSFFLDCCEKSKMEEIEFGKVFWQGKYKILEDNNTFSIDLANKQQVDNFINFIRKIKLKK